MRFDFEAFSKFARRAYDNVVAQGDTVYNFEDALAVFRYYFSWYEYARHRRHPNIRLPQIESILVAMPYVEEHCHKQIETYDIELKDYSEIIPQHFKTRYARCDYNINHFFSGDIRMLRYYETCYRR